MQIVYKSECTFLSNGCGAVIKEGRKGGREGGRETDMKKRRKRRKRGNRKMEGPGK